MDVHNTISSCCLALDPCIPRQTVLILCIFLHYICLRPRPFCDNTTASDTTLSSSRHTKNYNIMNTRIVLTSIAVALFAIGSYRIGLFDRPEFEFHNSILTGVNSRDRTLNVVIATSTSKDIGGNVARLLTGTKKPLDGVDNFKAYLSQAAKDYGAPDGADSLSVGLYFDDPSSVDSPRWGIGWAVSAPTYQDLVDVWDHIRLLYTGDEQIRLVRIGPGPILKAKIPWRTFLTPMIGPMLHWRRGFRKFADGGYEATNGRDTNIAAVACEVYVSGKNDTMEYIDYIVVMGDTKAIWDDSFPEERILAEDPPVINNE